MSKPIVYSTLKMKKISLFLQCKFTTQIKSCQVKCYLTYGGIKWKSISRNVF